MSTTLTANRISTHGPATEGILCHYKNCGRKFKSPAALNMHVGRAHTKTIPTASSQAIADGLKAVRKVAEQAKPILNGTGAAHPRGLLTDEEVESVIFYLNTHGKEHPTKAAAFKAALESIGAEQKIKMMSSNVDRYWKKAAKAAITAMRTVPAVEAAVVTPRVKRKYVRRSKPTIPHIPINPNAQECVLTSPGLRIEFSAKILPTILHTIAMSIGKEK